LRLNQQEYSVTLNSNNPDNKILSSQREALQNLQNEIGEYRVDAQKKINKVFNDDQLAYFGGAHHFLMGMNGYGNIMGSRGYGANGCYGYNSNQSGNQSARGPRGMMNQQ